MGLRLLHLNLHGLVRSHDLELGRDADTGGQTLYVLELVRGLAARPEVDQIDLVTRLIQDRKVSSDYSQPIETISSSARILRLPFGPKRYLRKELLWPYLDALADQLVRKLQDSNNLPDWIHAHYADAGYVGSLVSRRLNIPLVFTAHSLGREKQRRLLAAGLDHEQIEQNYSISRRIEAEELALDQSCLVVTSTKQEAEDQYSRYGRYVLERSEVVPPGVDSKRFHPKSTPHEINQIDQLVSPFLQNSSLPPLLAISRAVRRKNIPALVEAYGRSSVLRQRHNLVLILGCRNDLRQLEKQQREVFQQLFDLVDRYDLYGHIAYPKTHKRDQIPSIYRWAADLKGLFVNPALTEPFGLTLLEASASGLPTVATDDGGPKDILLKCENGLLADVTDLESLQDTIEQAGSERNRWHRWSDNGIEAIARHFSWDAHVCNYLALSKTYISKSKSHPKLQLNPDTQTSNYLGNRLLLLDLDSSLELPETEDLTILRMSLENEAHKNINSLGILTGRGLKAARQRYSELHLPEPKLWICNAGTEIYYGIEDKPDLLWESFIALDWNKETVQQSLSDLKDHLEEQETLNQGPFKVSYLLKEPGESILSLVRKRLRNDGLAAMPYLRCHWYLDVLPIRASRKEAIRYLAVRYEIPLEDVLVVASEQGDGELIRGLTSAIIPAEHDPCLELLRSQQGVYFSPKSKVNGLLDGINHYRYFSSH